MQGTWATAAAFALRGYRVFPLGRRDGAKYKEPITPNGHKDATNDLKTIQGWAAAYPNNNYGIACGPSNLTVIDMDVKDGMNGIEDFVNFQRLMSAEWVDFDKEFYVETPSGGRHLYYQGAIERQTKKFANHKSIDVKSTSGYVVGPGCGSPDGKEYRDYGAKLPRRLPKSVEKFASRGDAPPPAATSNERKTIEADQLREVLAAIPVGDYANNWTDVIMAVRACDVYDGERLLEHHEKIDILNEWSATDDGVMRDGVTPRYQGRDVVADKYEDFRDDGRYTIASVVQMAKDGGWRPTPKADASRFANAMLMPTTDHIPTTVEGWDEKTLQYATWDAAAKNPEWLIKGLIEREGLHLLSGFYGTKKSFLLLTMLLDLCRGRSPFGENEETRHKVKKPLRCMYVAGEGAFGFKPRIDAYLRHRNLDGSELDNFFFVREMPLLYEPEKWKVFVEWVKSKDIDILACDTWARLIAGLDGNSTRDASLAVQRLQELQRLGVAVVVVHHTGKDESRGSKGAVDLPAAAELELIVRSKSPDDELHLGMRKIKNGKSWDEDMCFKVHEVAMGVDEDGDPIESLTLEFAGPAEAPPPEPTKGLTKAETDNLDKATVTAKCVDRMMTEMTKPEHGLFRPDKWYSAVDLKREIKRPELRDVVEFVLSTYDTSGIYKGSQDQLAKYLDRQFKYNVEDLKAVFGDRMYSKGEGQSTRYYYRPCVEPPDPL